MQLCRRCCDWLLHGVLCALTLRCQRLSKTVLNQPKYGSPLVQLATVNVGLFFKVVRPRPLRLLCVIVSAVLLFLNIALFVYFGQLLIEAYYCLLTTFGFHVVTLTVSVSSHSQHQEDVVHPTQLQERLGS